MFDVGALTQLKRRVTSVLLGQPSLGQPSLAPIVLPPSTDAKRRCPGCDRPLARYQQCVPCRRPMTERNHYPRRTPEQRMAISARKLGQPIEEYRAHIEAGEKWCVGCKAWHPRDAFPPCFQDRRSGKCFEWTRAYWRQQQERSRVR